MGHAFIPFINPLLNLVFPAGFLADQQCCKIIQHHNLDREQWQMYSDMDKALKKQLLSIFDDVYTSDLKHPLLGYAPSATLQVLNHLYNTWGNITSTILEEGMEKIKTPLNSTCPISHIWEQIQQRQALATAACQPFTKPQLINMAYHAIFVLGFTTETY
eukprot:756374-Ditylum_brightwellii.AAC.1